MHPRLRVPPIRSLWQGPPPVLLLATVQGADYVLSTADGVRRGVVLHRSVDHSQIEVASLSVQYHLLACRAEGREGKLQLRAPEKEWIGVGLLEGTYRRWMTKDPGDQICKVEKKDFSLTTARGQVSATPPRSQLTGDSESLHTPGCNRLFTELGKERRRLWMTCASCGRRDLRPNFQEARNNSHPNRAVNGEKTSSSTQTKANNKERTTFSLRQRTQISGVGGTGLCCGVELGLRGTDEQKGAKLNPARSWLKSESDLMEIGAVKTQQDGKLAKLWTAGAGRQHDGAGPASRRRHCGAQQPEHSQN